MKFGKSMKQSSTESDIESVYDTELVKIADYVQDYQISSLKAYEMASVCLKDALGCAMLALRFPECLKLLGPVVKGSVIPDGARVPGTQYVLDPIQAAFNIGAMIRWVDFNDAWFGQEWAHPSDNIGGILAVADYRSRALRAKSLKPLTMKDVLTYIIKAHEIQGILSLENSFNKLGIDHVVLVKLASAAVITQILGGKKNDILATLSQVFLDGQSLRTYRHFPNTGPRKSWASADASSRAVRLSMMTLQGEPGYPTVLSAKTWGFYDAVFKGNSLKFPMPFGSYVIEHILFKASFPAEVHAQTAVEAAFILHKELKHPIAEIEKIKLHTQESALRIITKTGPLKNFADRDHCIQYMIAVALIYGKLNADSFDDVFAKDPRIDVLREKIEVIEDKKYSQDYLDPNKRSVANDLQIFFKDGSNTEKVVVEFPLGHPERRKEGLVALEEKFKIHLATRFPKRQMQCILDLFEDQARFEAMPVDAFMENWII
jgi:2-methylcitrate dehydratase